MSIQDSSGTEIWSNNFDRTDQGYRGDQNFKAGKYYVELQSYLGCTVGDSVELQAIASNVWWLSTTGSDANDGTKTSSLATVQEALSRACDGDTIILQDGTYFENVEMDWNNGFVPIVTIASEYILDSNLSHTTNTVMDGMDDASTVAVDISVFELVRV